jgi:DNA-binding PadR family transcriptional regulator
MKVRHALLALLSEGPRHGTQLREGLGAWTGALWPLNTAEVDATLALLERDGLVESGGTQPAGPQQGFRITADGAAELAAWLVTPPGLASPPDDQMAAKVLAALRVPGTDVHEVIQWHRRYLMQLMQQWTRIKHDKADHDLGLALRIDAELFRLDSVIQWLDTASRHLTHAVVRPAPRPAPPALPQLDGRTGGPPGGADHQEARRADDRIRISDRDRERATARLCDHFAEGRLTREELDERITAALSARTAGDLRRVTADLPAPASARQSARTPPTAPGPGRGRRGPVPLMPVALAALGVLLITDGRWPSVAFLPAVLVQALTACAAAMTAGAWLWRRLHRH